MAVDGLHCLRCDWTASPKNGVAHGCANQGPCIVSWILGLVLSLGMFVFYARFDTLLHVWSLLM